MKPRVIYRVRLLSEYFEFPSMLQASQFLKSAVESAVDTEVVELYRIEIVLKEEGGETDAETERD